MKSIYFGTAFACSLAFVATSCIDESYDLSDIDTTTQIKVDKLTLPVNLEPVVLGDIIKVKEGDQIKEITINGNTFYGIQEEGSFNSDEIEVPSFVTNAPTISAVNVDLFPTLPKTQKGRKEASIPGFALQEPIRKPIQFSANGIDKSIVNLTAIKTKDVAFTLKLALSAPGVTFGEVSLSNVTLGLPEGLNVVSAPGRYTYNATNGEIVFHDPIVMKDGKADIAIVANKVDLASNPGFTFKQKECSMTLDTHFDVNSLSVNVNTVSGNIPSKVNLNINYSLSAINATAFSGRVQYDLSGNKLNISPIQLNDLPDFLAQDETNLILANPQIYININNPLAKEKLTFQTGIEITPFRNGVPSKSPLTLDKGIWTVDGTDANARYNYCLSPKMPTDIPEAFSKDLHHEPFTSLSNVVSGNGLPSKVEIKLKDPMIPETDVVDFELSRKLNAVDGKWEFLAPLALVGDGTTGSRVIYTDKVDGWGSEDLEKLTISELLIEASVDNTLPLTAKLSGYPVDKNGKRIGNANIEATVLTASTENIPVVIRLTEEISGLDGIVFTAEVTPRNDSKPLAPSQQIVLKNLKATVSGHYTTEF